MLAAFVPLGYHPIFFNEVGEQIGMMDKIILCLTILLFLTVLPLLKKCFRSRFLTLYILLFLIISFDIFLYYSLGLHIQYKEIRTLLIPLVLVVIGYLSNIRQENVWWISFVYSIVMVYVGYEQIRLNVGGFVIEDIYHTSAKNSLGPMLTVAGIIAILNILRGKSKSICVFMSIIAFLVLVELLTIRARLATVAYCVMVAFLLYKYICLYSRKMTLIVILILLFVIGITGISFFDSFFDFFYESFFQNKEDDLLSGRGTGYLLAFDLFCDNPLFGNLSQGIKIPWVHNYLLLKMSDLGFLGGLPWFCLYFYIVFQIIKGSFSTNIFLEQNYGYILMWIPFIASLGEPTFPYGPGTATFIPFILLGMTLKFNRPVN